MTLNSYGVVFLVVAIIMVVVLPRGWAALPLIGAASLMTLGQEIEVVGFHFSIIRLVAAAGFVRVLARGERLSGGMNGLDWLMLVWSGWVLASSCCHKVPSEALVFRLGMVYNTCGIYFLCRVFCQSKEDLVRLFKSICIVLFPVALEMLYEKVAAHNLFSVFGGVLESPLVRLGKIRAQGPFAHPILAGTVGAVILPFMMSLWQDHKKVAIIGIATSAIMIGASGSSGPVMSAIAAAGAMAMWVFRGHMRFVRWVAVVMYIGLELVMEAPAYFLLARIDISGGSTGWHRAQLIESAIAHLNEWWLVGTDYTRHWMPTGVFWNPDHTDITNHYLGLGVLGGLPVMLLFIACIAKCFWFVGETVRKHDASSRRLGFMAWALGAALFAHVTTFLSVSYFDQSFVFIYVTFAAIASAWSGTKTPVPTERANVLSQHYGSVLRLGKV